MTMTAADARIVDPILSDHAAGYSNAEFVARHLFPIVPVDLAGGKRIEFNKDMFRRINTRRAPGAVFARVETGYAGAPYALENHGVEAPVPQEILREAADGPGVDLSREAVEAALNVVDLELECASAEIATDPASYGAAAAEPDAAWNDGGLPVTDINAAKSHIRGRIGRRPNTLLLGARALEAIKINAEVLSYYKNQDGPLTLEQIKRVFEVDNLAIGEAVKLAGETMVDIWPDVAVLAYVPPEPGRSQRQPSYGYTYRMRGHPAVMEPYMERQTNSYIHQVVLDRAPLLTGVDAGFLLHGLAPVGP